jgi:hypothetical protein
MDKKIAGLLGAVASWVTMGAAHATTATPMPNPSEALQASSYADLLAPVENAVALVKADDVVRARSQSQSRELEGTQQDVPEGNVQLADYWQRPRAHHHHHHHQAYRHHHHHHHHASVVGIPGVGAVVVR